MMRRDAMSADDFTDLEARFDQLPLKDQLLLVERLLRRIRRGKTYDEAAFARGVTEMANDQDFLRAAGMDNEPRPN
jgi:hypothetical protein